MENIKELLDLTSQSCNTRSRALGSLPAKGALNSDQVISLSPRDGVVERAPGPGLKLQASSFRTNLFKHQAASIKPQAQGFKRQAASSKLLDHGPWKKF